MKKENDEISELFRNRLSHAEMEVREGFWQELSSDLDLCKCRQRLVFFRIAAAASVLLVLGVSSAAFWFFSPKEEIGEAFTQVAAVSGNGNTLDGDVVKQQFTPILSEPVLKRPAPRSAMAFASSYPAAEDDSVSVTLSMSFSFSATRRTVRDPHHYSDENLWQAATNSNPVVVTESETSCAERLAQAVKSKTWAVKASVGTSLPAAEGKYEMPVTAGLTIEKRINKHLAVETGLMYSSLRAEQNLHYLGIPVKMNVTLARTPKLELYASLGGVADKCIAGAPDNSFRKEPVQLALTAGVGVNYQINDRIALFAEPGVSHHFKTDSKLETLRTARPTNFNLICGLRMTY